MKSTITIKGLKIKGVSVEEIKIEEDCSATEINKVVNSFIDKACEIVLDMSTIKEIDKEFTEESKEETDPVKIKEAENENNSKEEIEQQSSVNEPMVGQCPHPSAKESLEKEVKIDSLVLDNLQRKYFERFNNELKNGEELKVDDYLDVIINLVGIKYDYIYECSKSFNELENDYLFRFMNKKIDEVEDKWISK